MIIIIGRDSYATKAQMAHYRPTRHTAYYRFKYRGKWIQWQQCFYTVQFHASQYKASFTSVLKCLRLLEFNLQQV